MGAVRDVQMWQQGDKVPTDEQHPGMRLRAEDVRRGSTLQTRAGVPTCNDVVQEGGAR